MIGSVGLRWPYRSILDSATALAEAAVFFARIAADFAVATTARGEVLDVLGFRLRWANRGGVFNRSRNPGCFFVLRPRWANCGGVFRGNRNLGRSPPGLATDVGAAACRRRGSSEEAATNGSAHVEDTGGAGSGTARLNGGRPRLVVMTVRGRPFFMHFKVDFLTRRARELRADLTMTAPARGLVGWIELARDPSTMEPNTGCERKCAQMAANRTQLFAATAPLAHSKSKTKIVYKADDPGQMVATGPNQPTDGPNKSTALRAKNVFAVGPLPTLNNTPSSATNKRSVDLREGINIGLKAARADKPRGTQIRLKRLRKIAGRGRAGQKGFQGVGTGADRIFEQIPPFFASAADVTGSLGATVGFTNSETGLTRIGAGKRGIPRQVKLTKQQRQERASQKELLPNTTPQSARAILMFANKLVNTVENAEKLPSRKGGPSQMAHHNLKRFAMHPEATKQVVNPKTQLPNSTRGDPDGVGRPVEFKAGKGNGRRGLSNLVNPKTQLIHASRVFGLDNSQLPRVVAGKQEIVNIHGASHIGALQRWACPTILDLHARRYTVAFKQELVHGLAKPERPAPTHG